MTCTNTNSGMGRRGWGRGQAMTEFPLVVLYWIGLIYGIASTSLGIYSYSFVSQASRDAVRYAMVLGSDVTISSQATQSSVKNYVVSKAHGFAYSSLGVTATWPSGNKPGNLVKVTVTYNYQPLYPFSAASLPLSASAQSVIAY
jgi:Flp pilus assembly protein TadG